MKIKDGGQTSSLQSQIAEVRINANFAGQMELWITDNTGNESLSYLTMDEAIGLAEELKGALRNRINQI